ncbi:MAG: hypothetical protein EOP52_00530 [Sphingobacteriales bacterium]|nr:MAG: hypothetical protein EOP52_00530 [Sphingobacteriales bacterium]
MKTIAVLLLAGLSMVPVSSDAQSRKKRTSETKRTQTSKANYDQNFYNFTGYYDANNSAAEAARRMSQVRTYDSTYSFVNRRRFGGWSRPINESTEGVMGQDELRLNETGEYRNLNSNTGVALPPSNGTNR